MNFCSLCYGQVITGMLHHYTCIRCHSSFNSSGNCIERKNAHITAAVASAPKMPAHVLYVTGDDDVPSIIQDSNGHVMLGLCKVCGRGEAELIEPCTLRCAPAYAPKPSKVNPLVEETAKDHLPTWDELDKAEPAQLIDIDTQIPQLMQVAYADIKRIIKEYCEAGREWRHATYQGGFGPRKVLKATDPIQNRYEQACRAFYALEQML